ncbi:uncharacterized protein I303_107067 [Kwoniella dejecticola CBS 10117]|uniref:Uncharacterized protein n=1 Tax=Kwoniella dejecticola CBS 10117 TaxID=1296121 RepID=A0A1A5ZYM6_9TREE|nr:uncharacterized protein I303_06468 [Kwoniella dejecticola CBS 10117]OBR82910.1 hypothetical protein I303_06468 [Kwoniella dejecticola CBS 10117]
MSNESNQSVYGDFATLHFKLANETTEAGSDLARLTIVSTGHPFGGPLTDNLSKFLQSEFQRAKDFVITRERASATDCNYMLKPYDRALKREWNSGVLCDVQVDSSFGEGVFSRAALNVQSSTSVGDARELVVAHGSVIVYHDSAEFHQLARESSQAMQSEKLTASASPGQIAASNSSPPLTSASTAWSTPRSGLSNGQPVGLASSGAPSLPAGPYMGQHKLPYDPLLPSSAGQYDLPTRGSASFWMKVNIGQGVDTAADQWIWNLKEMGHIARGFKDDSQSSLVLEKALSNNKFALWKDKDSKLMRDPSDPSRFAIDIGGITEARSYRDPSKTLSDGSHLADYDFYVSAPLKETMLRETAIHGNRTDGTFHFVKRQTSRTDESGAPEGKLDSSPSVGKVQELDPYEKLGYIM